MRMSTRTVTRRGCYFSPTPPPSRLTQTHVGSIPDLPGVAGVLIDSDNNLLFTSDRGCSRVSVFACADKMPLGQVTVGAHPNGLAYDPERRRLYAFNLGDPIGEDCSVSVVDIDSMTVEAEIPLPGRPRWAVYDPASTSSTPTFASQR